MGMEKRLGIMEVPPMKVTLLTVRKMERGGSHGRMDRITREISSMDFSMDMEHITSRIMTKHTKVNFKTVRSKETEK